MPRSARRRGQMLAQRARGRVACHSRQGAASSAPGQAAQEPGAAPLRGIQCGRQPAAARLQHLVAGVQRLARHPERIDGAIETRTNLRQRERGERAGDEKARARPRPNNAFRRQPLISLHHGRGGNRHDLCKTTDGRQFCPRRQRASGDPLPDRGHDTPRTRVPASMSILLAISIRTAFVIITVWRNCNGLCLKNPSGIAYPGYKQGWVPWTRRQADGSTAFSEC